MSSISEREFTNLQDLMTEYLKKNSILALLALTADACEAASKMTKDDDILMGDNSSDEQDDVVSYVEDGDYEEDEEDEEEIEQAVEHISGQKTKSPAKNTDKSLAKTPSKTAKLHGTPKLDYPHSARKRGGELLESPITKSSKKGLGRTLAFRSRRVQFLHSEDDDGEQIVR